MRPSLSAPCAAQPQSPGSVSLNDGLTDLLRNSPGLPKPRTARATTRTKPGPRAEQKTIRCAVARCSEEEVSFYLQRLAGGLYVEREAFPRGGTRTNESVVFSDRNSFERWCSDDPIRFRHPLLFAQLKRDADALWAIAD